MRAGADLQQLMQPWPVGQFDKDHFLNGADEKAEGSDADPVECGTDESDGNATDDEALHRDDEKVRVPLLTH